MTGCCFDEKKSNDGLTPYEVSQAVKSAKSAAGYVENLEFIGYDCCLMQVQDIAGLNSEYANYQVASEESEWGYGWTYDKWIKDLYQKKSTTAILDSIVNSFRDETEATYAQWQIQYPSENIVNDQTLSYLNLNAWGEYETAWEDMSSTLSGIITSSSKWNTFGNLLKTCQRFGLTQVDYWGTTDYAYDVFDTKDFFAKIKNSSTYNSNSTLMSKINTCESALSNLISYSWNGSGSPDAHGVTMFAPVSGYSSESDYGSTATTLSTWRAICSSYGNW